MLVATVTIDHAKVDADLTDFPVFIDLSDLGNTFWNTVKSGGGDIRVYKNNGTTQLAREVVSCDTTAKTGELHVKYTGTLSSTTDTTIQIWADGTSSEPTASSTYGSEAVWGSNYVAVYHMKDSNDSTSNGNNGTTTGATSGAIGKIEEAYDFTGADDDTFNFPSTINSAIASNISFSGWVKFDEFQAYGGIFQDWSGDYANIIFSVKGTADGLQLSSHDGGEHHGQYDLFCSLNFSVGEYVLLGFTRSSTPVLSIYINGVKVASGTGGADDKGGQTPNSIFMGVNFDGVKDETRLSNNVLSSAWISTEYNNQNSPSTFYSVSEPTPPAINSTNFFQFF